VPAGTARSSPSTAVVAPKRLVSPVASMAVSAAGGRGPLRRVGAATVADTGAAPSADAGTVTEALLLVGLGPLWRLLSGRRVGPGAELRRALSPRTPPTPEVVTTGAPGTHRGAAMSSLTARSREVHARLEDS